ncbi:MAG TPA: hypothetical protein VFQ05_13505 [Candidatus Eisenbacteria bacterium]|nr:hypothetical protein [Candidatus Eisenbacteria bacterium]
MLFPAVPRALFVLVPAAMLVAPAWAGWSTSPVPVRPTSSAIPVVAACNDGGYGTFVGWQEESSPGSGQIRIQHLLPTGDPDPGWPTDGVVVCARLLARPTLGLAPDRLGGVYAWWIEMDGGPKLYVARLEAGGSAPSGWPVDGLSLGSQWSATYRPSVIEDESHGIYLAWTTGTLVRAHHLGPDGLGAGGWPDTPRIVVPIDGAFSSQLWPDLALAEDGGVFLSWATWSPDTTMVESSLRARRLTPAGANSPGWQPEGLLLGPFRPEPLGQAPRAPLLDIAPDGRGGFFAHIGVIQELNLFIDTRLHRISGDGQHDPGWPAEGFLVKADATYYNPDQPYAADVGLRVHQEQDRAIVEFPNPYSDSPALVGVSQMSNSGVLAWPSSVVAVGHEVVVRPNGGFYGGDFKCCGPASQWDWPALLGLHAEPDGDWPSHFEVHTEPVITWYGDIALASTGDGGVVYYWSQSNVLQGLFARRFNPTNEVTGVGATIRLPGLYGLRFTAGVGVAARVQLDGNASRLELFDLGGRSLASRPISGSGSFEVTLPGTASLASGVYFARLISGSTRAFGKVAVTR